MYDIQIKHYIISTKRQENRVFLIRVQTNLDTTEVWLNCLDKTCLLVSLEIVANTLCPPRACRWFDLVRLMFIYDQHNNSTYMRSVCFFIFSSSLES